MNTKDDRDEDTDDDRQEVREMNTKDDCDEGTDDDRQESECHADDPGEAMTLEQLKMQMLTVPEVAEILRVSEYLVYELVRRSEIPHIRVGGRILISRYALAEWIERNTIAA